MDYFVWISLNIAVMILRLIQYRDKIFTRSFSILHLWCAYWYIVMILTTLWRIFIVLNNIFPPIVLKTNMILIKTELLLPLILVSKMPCILTTLKHARASLIQRVAATWEFTVILQYSRTNLYWLLIPVCSWLVLVPTLRLA